MNAQWISLVVAGCGWLISFLVGVVVYFMQRAGTRRDECLRHLEKNIEELRLDRALFLVQQEKLRGDASNVSGKVELLITGMRDIGLDIKGISPRLSILETRVQNVEKK